MPTPSSAATRAIALFATLAALTAPLGAAGSAAQCKIGRPFYCYKYGEGRCPVVNGLSPARRAKACQRWTSACLDCHNAIPSCLGGRRPSAASPDCQRCDSRWRLCMRKADRLYWTNRMIPQ